MAKIDELKVKYPKVTSTVTEKFQEGDTTPTKKYLEYMFKMWSTKNERRFDMVLTSDALIKKIKEFDTLLPYIENKDIYSYKTFKALVDIIGLATVIKKDKEFVREDHIDVLVENDDYILMRPKTHEGSLKYGSNTKWCTASKNYSHTFRNYTRSGYLYYLISKKERNKNYDKIAFYSEDKTNLISGNYDIYNQIDNNINERLFITNGWSAYDLFEIMSKIRLHSYEINTIEKAKKDVEKTFETIKNIDLDDFLQKINLLERYGNEGNFEGKEEMEKIIRTLSEKTKDLFGDTKISS